MKIRLLSTIAILAVVVVACSRNKDAGVNLVDGVSPRWDDLHQRAAVTLVALREMPASERQAYLRAEWPTLQNDIIAQLQMADRLPGNRADSVVFHFGSGQGVRADDRTADQHDGFFSDELVAYV